MLFDELIYLPDELDLLDSLLLSIILDDFLCDPGNLIGQRMNVVDKVV